MALRLGRALVAFMETNYGPTLKARERLTPEGSWDACRAEILAMCERRNEATDGTLLMRAEYLVAVGQKTTRVLTRDPRARRAAGPSKLDGVTGTIPVRS